MSFLLSIRGPLTGARLHLEGEQVAVGRDTNNDIPLEDNAVSRNHVVFRKVRLGWVVEDCDSAGGTFLNGEKINRPIALNPNDEIQIGQSLFLFDTEFDVQNADFSDNSVFFSTSHDETMAIEPVATLDPQAPSPDSSVRQGMEFLTEIGDLFDSSRIPFGEALQGTLQRLSRIFRSDIAMLMLYDHGTAQLRVSAVVANGDVLADKSIISRVYAEKRAVMISDQPELLDHPSPDAPPNPNLRSIIAAPMTVDEACLGVLSFERHELDAYTLKELRLIQSVGRLLGVFIEARQRAEALALRVNYQEPSSSVIGVSRAFRQVLDMIRRIADTPASILLIGETGTGKEVLASEIHRLSPQGRSKRPFIALNCAAIPESLFESQLFGHEKGSFTGASRMHQGYIEQAQGGTLFLDEIGELSLAMQPKILRFLQEHTFTRVGGNRVLRAEVRVIAATNRDLVKEVEEGRFREDLYHRLNVFPINIPPLRERREDIRILAEHFCQTYAKSMKREILGISEDALIQLEKHHWQGNIRELSNCIERAVLLCDEKIMLPRHFLFSQSRTTPSMGSTTAVQFTQPGKGEPLRPLAEVEKEHIIRVLKSVEHNQIKAADILGIHRNTLRKKMKEYGS
jgi:Nif-specific regulatory protein